MYGWEWYLHMSIFVFSLSVAFVRIVDEGFSCGYFFFFFVMDKIFAELLLLSSLWRCVSRDFSFIWISAASIVWTGMLFSFFFLFRFIHTLSLSSLPFYSVAIHFASTRCMPSGEFFSSSFNDEVSQSTKFVSTNTTRSVLLQFVGQLNSYCTTFDLVVIGIFVWWIKKNIQKEKKK